MNVKKCKICFQRPLLMESDYFKDVTVRRFYFYGCLCGKATTIHDSEYLWIARKEWNKTVRFVVECKEER